MLKLTFIILCLFMASLAMASPDVNSTNIKGYNFSIRDVQQFCSASRDSAKSISIQCSEKRLKPVARSCEGWITAGLNSIKFSCGGGLWVLNSACTVKMRGASGGEVSCTPG